MADTALIVGASRGIGLGLTGEMVGRGWDVVATARDLTRADALTALAGRMGGKVRLELVDVTETSSIKAFKERLTGQTFDLIIFNAGISGARGINPVTVSGDEFAHLFITNALAPARLAELLVSQMRPHSGVIAFISAILGSIGGPRRSGMELLGASKAALNALTRSFATRHHDKALAVLSLHPGWVKTDLGGPNADIDVATSVKGLADVIDRARHDRISGFFDYKGETVPW